MIRVKLDIGDLAFLRAAPSIQPLIDNALVGIAESARNKWVKLAQSHLTTTRGTYLQGIQSPNLERSGMAVVDLVGKLPNMIEQGASGFDIKEAMLNAQHKVSSEGHRFRVVGLQMLTPKARGVNAQSSSMLYERPGADSHSRRQGVASGSMLIAKEIFAKARQLKSGQSLPRHLGLRPLNPKHSNSPFDSLQAAGAKGHRYYVAFRTMSDGVNKWQHPGLRARRFADVVAAHVSEIGPRALRRVAKQAFGQTGDGDV